MSDIDILNEAVEAALNVLKTHGVLNLDLGE